MRYRRDLSSFQEISLHSSLFSRYFIHGRESQSDRVTSFSVLIDRDRDAAGVRARTPIRRTLSIRENISEGSFKNHLKKARRDSEDVGLMSTEYNAEDEAMYSALRWKEEKEKQPRLYVLHFHTINNVRLCILRSVSSLAAGVEAVRNDSSDAFRGHTAHVVAEKVRRKSLFMPMSK